MRLSIVVVCAIAACGRIAFDPVAVDGAGDVAPDASCTFGAWVGVSHVASVGAATKYDDWEPALHPNGLLLVFQSNRVEGSALYAVARASLDAPFGPARELTELYGAGGNDGAVSPMWSHDGSQLYYIRYQTIGSGPVVADYVGGDMFGTWAATELPYPQRAWDISEDGLELFYTDDVSGPDADLVHATRLTVGDPWMVDSLLDPLNVAGENQGWPTFDEARQQLYFESSNAGDYRIVSATRSARGQPFGAATPVDELGPDAGDPDITPDGASIAFASDRLGGAGSDDLYVATRTCE